MQQILVYADSLSWGIIPDTRRRHPFDVRWPGVLENRLNARGENVRVIEDCLNGRRTVWEDPFKPGRDGRQGLAQRIEAASPLALVVLMLGINDFQSMHPHNAWHSAQGMSVLVETVRSAPVEPGMPIPPILIVAPPKAQKPKGIIADKFLDADIKCMGLPEALREIADTQGCAYFDSNQVIATSRVDGVHLDAGAHIALGEALADVVQKLLPKDSV